MDDLPSDSYYVETGMMVETPTTAPHIVVTYWRACHACVQQFGMDTPSTSTYRSHISERLPCMCVAIWWGYPFYLHLTQSHIGEIVMYVRSPSYGLPQTSMERDLSAGQDNNMFIREVGY